MCDFPPPWHCQSCVDESELGNCPLVALKPLNIRGSNGNDTPINKALQESLRNQSYVVDNPRDAYYRVLYSNETSEDRSKSVVGLTGHIERANAWTHLIASVLFAVYATARIWIVDQNSLTAQLSGVSCMAIAIMFAVSMTYHVYGTVPGCASIMRNLDIIAIYLSMAFGIVADSAMLTKDFADAPLQTMADPFVAAVALVIFFAVRRWFLSSNETRDYQFDEYCALGIFRFQHSDLEHAGLRVAGVVALTFSWILSVSAAFDNLIDSVAAIWMVGVSFATTMLIFGVVFDNLLLPDYAYAKGDHSWYKCTQCHSKYLGCAMTSHAWWHVISFVGVVVMTTAREYSISQLSWTQ